MQLRLGFVANALSLWDASPSKTMTFKRYGELSEEERNRKLLEVTSANLEHTKRILYYLASHEIPLYRMSSSMVPLATHPEVKWDFVSPFKEEWKELGRLIKKFNIRTSYHPNQFTLFTSPKESVTDNAVEDMVFHYKMLEAMDVHEQSLINIHIGGTYGNKEEALARFHQNLQKLPSHVKEIMTLENDDKTYTVEETLEVCEKEGIPMILDVHHHQANQSSEPLQTYLPRIFDTWKHRDLRPKIHVSSPKSEKAFRSHADNVDIDFVLSYLKMLKELDEDTDIMIEAKNKDIAMLKLTEDIAKIRGVKRVGGGTLNW
ncbi:UV DNA damage repair endonuclease UvsE [Rossellomorea vietnamensis]|uniref:UV DNA damage endonuclease n=1 Tax=Rossellomorea vietnamensis TaxID=218284 RepID=A0A5D4NZ71_9BACI|nr:UV DNA damage repair endonuclease UvsE [Rossellomorea vietnamensis]TYS17932.1 UV DNA damage repair endonuclease UvsE [Rossellomorea vietnamensis]